MKTRKFMKRFLSGFMSASMLISTMSLSMFAANIEDVAAKDAPKIKIDLFSDETTENKVTSVLVDNEEKTVVAVREVIAEMSSIETIVNTSSTGETKAVAPVYDVIDGVKEDKGGMFDYQFNSGLTSKYSKYESWTNMPIDADVRYVGTGEHSKYYVYSAYVEYERNEDGSTKIDENGNYIIKELRRYDDVTSPSLTINGEETTELITKLSLEPQYDNPGGSRPFMFAMMDRKGQPYYGYCCDLDTPTNDGFYYVIANLEDSDYYGSEESEAHIRSIVMNGYWGTTGIPAEDGTYAFGSLELLKQKLIAYLDVNPDLNTELTAPVLDRNNKYQPVTDPEGNIVTATKTMKEMVEGLTSGEALLATQAAIWTYANGSYDVLNGKDGSIILDPDGYKWNHDAMGNSKNAGGYTNGEAMDDFASAAVDFLYTWLINLETEEESTIVINDKNFVENIALEIGNKVAENTYLVDVSFELGFVPGEKDDLSIELTYGDTTVTKALTGETAMTAVNGRYIIEDLALVVNETSQLSLHLVGKQYLEHGAYVYLAHGGREKSQNSIGVAEGEKNIDITKSVNIKFDVKDYAEVTYYCSVAGEKTWNDDNNKYNTRPDSIVINLYADGTKIETKTVTAEDGWAWKFTKLLKNNEDGNEIEYVVTEEKVTGYASVIHGYDIENTLITTSVSGQKTWNDANNQDGKRPESITVNLLANGVEIEEATVTAAEDWKYSFEDLPKYNMNGAEIVYTVTEDAVEGYTVNIKDYNITNTYTPELTEVAVTKTWEDNHDQDGKRPASITVNLLADGEEIAEAVITAADGWKYTFANLPAYANGQKITYTITEDPVAEYTAEIDGYNIKNCHTPKTTEVAGQKTWNDANNQDGKRPASITVNLLANGEIVDSKTVTAENGWKYTFANLPVYANGQKITYTVTEEAVADYTASVNGYDITNTYAPGKVSVSGSKIWNDNNNQDGKRPASITVRLYADGTEIATRVVTAAEGWAWNFEDLDEYANGQKITYTVSEDAVAGYTAEVNGYNITNTHTSAKTSVAGSKIWNDNNNQDGKRPVSITVNLLADGVKVASKTVTAADGWAWSFDNLDEYAGGKQITYVITEEAVAGYTSEVNGYNITNSYTPGSVTVSGTKSWNDANNQDGKRPASITVNLLADGSKVASKTVTAADGWKYTFADLPEYQNGKKITYTVTEDAIAGYTASVNGYDITNTYATETVTVSGSKTWNDANNQDGKRPASITINLLADGAKVASKTVTAADGWAWSFEGLAKYAAGKLIDYTITEDTVKDYTVSYNGYNVTNTYVPGTTAVSGRKIWNDANDRDGLRPESITVLLLANGTIADSMTVTAADGWAWSFTDLDEYAAGEKITYTVSEVHVTGYTASISGYNITNTHTPETVNVSGTKTWNDADDQDGKRPDSIVINLLADGEIVDSKTVSAADGWAWSFENLAKYEDGKQIDYTVREAAVDGYTAEYDGYNVTNTYAPEVTRIAGNKIWKDANDKDGIRPATIRINLFADGKAIDTMLVTEGDGWAWDFGYLPVYRDGGIEIAYEIREEAVAGYTAAYDGYNVINTHVADTGLTLAGKKYLNGEAAGGFRFVQTDANGTVTDIAESAEDGTFAFAPITFDAEGTYTYTVKELLGDDEEIVYDESVYTIIVTVERDGEELNASYIVSKNGELYEGMIEFYNESLVELFEDPTPLGDAPKTGDNAVANVLIFIGFLTAGGAALKSKKRRRA